MTEKSQSSVKKPSLGLQSTEAPQRVPVMVVYSGYRASSTWFWSKLRENNQLLCYYEVFNEVLGQLTQSMVTTLRPSDWRSRHPDGAPYWLEYASLLQDSDGVAKFPTNQSLGGNIVSRAGIDGPLDPDIEDYLVSLVRESETKEKIAVLTCTRMLGIVSGMKARFDGLHVLLVRNLFRQWISFSGQNRTGNDYFIRMLYDTMSLKDRVPFISYLTSLFSDDEKNSWESWFNEATNDRVFCYFTVFHVYFLVHARRHVDLVVDINKLGDTSEEYKDNIEKIIGDRLGVQIDLSGAEDQIDYPSYMITSVEHCKFTVDTAVARALSDLDASPDDRKFASELLCDLWREQERFSFYTRSATEALAQAADMENVARRRAIAVEQESNDRVAAAEYEAQQQIIAVEGAAAEKASLAQEHLTALEQQSSAQILTLEEELRAVIDRASAADKSVLELLARAEMLEGKLFRRENDLRRLESELIDVREALHRSASEVDEVRAERQRLFERLDMDNGPMSLRAVLPLARLLRRLMRFHRRIYLLLVALRRRFM